MKINNGLFLNQHYKIIIIQIHCMFLPILYYGKPWKTMENLWKTLRDIWSVSGTWCFTHTNNLLSQLPRDDCPSEISSNQSNLEPSFTGPSRNLQELYNCNKFCSSREVCSYLHLPIGLLIARKVICICYFTNETFSAHSKYKKKELKIDVSNNLAQMLANESK